jgi:hypothetical protein
MDTMILQTLPPAFWNVKFTDIISVIVTLGLFIVYLRMKNIQNEQNKIQRQQNKLMSRQTDLMSANHQPRLNRNSIRGEGDTLITRITNRGNGPAEDLHIQCVVYEQTESEDGEPLFRKGFKREGTALVPRRNPLNRHTRTHSDGEEPNISGSRIEEGDDRVQFEATIKMKPLSMGSGGYEAPFSEVMQRINREWDSDNIAIEFWLIFKDVTGNPFGFWFGSFRDIELNSELDMQRAIDSGIERKRIGNPVREDEAASMMLIEPDDFDFGD